jgi:hypothetical protein
MLAGTGCNAAIRDAGPGLKKACRIFPGLSITCLQVVERPQASFSVEASNRSEMRPKPVHDETAAIKVTVNAPGISTGVNLMRRGRFGISDERLESMPLEHGLPQIKVG